MCVSKHTNTSCSAMIPYTQHILPHDTKLTLQKPSAAWEKMAPILPYYHCFHDNRALGKSSTLICQVMFS